MIIFFIKSTICLVVLYGFYHFSLQHQKILLFNRFYLIFSLIFSLIIPLIVIPVSSKFILVNEFDSLHFNTAPIIKGETIIENSSPFISFQSLLTTLFIIISLILFIRFVLNILKIIRKIFKSKKVEYQKTSLVLIEEKTPPYSFFRFVFVNRSDFESGKIENELLIHEEAHCLQYHSIDLMIIELLKVFLWFNPAIWLYRKAILLNHEYYADNEVLTSSDSKYYHQLLVKHVFQNNSCYLVSNFKNSLIRNRLIMMNKSKPPHEAIIRKICTVFLFLVLGITLIFSQESKIISNTTNPNNLGWIPIIQKHKIDLKKFRGMYTFGMGLGDSLNYAVLSGFRKYETNSQKNRIATFKNAIFIFPENKNTYWIIKSETAYHDFYNHMIVGKNGKMECFNFNSPDVIPIKTTSFQEFKCDTKAHKIFTTTSGYNID